VKSLRAQELRELGASYREASDATREKAAATRKLLAARDHTSRIQQKLAEELQAHSQTVGLLDQARQDAALMQHFLRAAHTGWTDGWKSPNSMPLYELSKLGVAMDGGHSAGYLLRDYRDYRPDFAETDKRITSWAKGLRGLSEDLGMTIPKKGGDQS
jgi:hypothetical protein